MTKYAQNVQNAECECHDRFFFPRPNSHAPFLANNAITDCPVRLMLLI